MRILRIMRFISLGANEIQKSFFEFKEKPSHFLILKPDEFGNKQLKKDSIMQPKGNVEMGSTHLCIGIWCFDYQEKEAEEILEEGVREAFIKEEKWLKKQLENLSNLKNRSETKVNIMY